MRNLLELFPEDDFGFRLTLRRGARADFFGPSAENESILVERRRVLTDSPHDYAIVPPKAQPAWAEFCARAEEWIGHDLSGDPVTVGGMVEPDVVLMTRDVEGVFRLTGGVVVFPSHWALAEKLGQTLSEIHGVVPGLNDAIGPAIDRYLEKLKPGFAAGRPNWGLAATAKMNLHPATHPKRLIRGMSFDDIWLRVEEQNLSVLPETGAILFGIRIERVRLRVVLADAEVRRRFRHTLATMPAAVATYKGLNEVMPDLLARLA